ncbi:MAG: hypothetical protein KY476_03590 [Planctomycetes bacterium]|nr:hypothetical protein [Planctomycetota bacterium]
MESWIGGVRMVAIVVVVAIGAAEVRCHHRRRREFDALRLRGRRSRPPTSPRNAG